MEKWARLTLFSFLYGNYIGVGGNPEEGSPQLLQPPIFLCADFADLKDANTLDAPQAGPLNDGEMPRTGFEPARLAALPPQSSASANSATWAFEWGAIIRLNPRLSRSLRLGFALDLIDVKLVSQKPIGCLLPD